MGGIQQRLSCAKVDLRNRQTRQMGAWLNAQQVFQASIRHFNHYQEAPENIGGGK